MRRIRPLLGLFVATLLAGCAQLSQNAMAPITPAQYPAEIARLEAIASQNSGSSEGWKANYQLAQRYMAYNNPARDYAKALANLEVYLSHNPAAAQDPQMQNLRAALEQIQSLSDDTRVARLRAELQASRRANQELQELNTELNSKIEMLKTLDHAVEEKRKTYITR